MRMMKKTNNTDGKNDQESKNRLKRLHDLEDIIDRGPVIYCIWRFHEEAPVEYISANIEQWGYKTEDFLSGRLSWYGITNPEDVTRLRSEILTNIKNKVWQFEQSYRILDSKGEIHWVEDQTVFIFDKAGKITHAQGAILDVTDRKKTQQALLESQFIYQAIFENTGTAIGIADQDRNIIMGNKRMEELTGYKKEELIGEKMRWDYFISSSDIELIKNHHRERLANPSAPSKQYECSIITRSGNVKNIYLTATMIPGTQNSLVSMVDITDRKKAEGQLQESEERLQELLHNSSDITVVVDEKGILKYVSPSVKRILNYDEKDMIGKSSFDFIHPDDIKSSIDALQEVAALENKGVATEFRFRHQNGSWIHLEALGNNCLANPAISGIIINCRDVTDRRRMETRLIQSQKMEAIGTLAGGIAHDFNNLLMGIQGYVSLMLLRKAPADPDFDKLNSVQNLVQSGADLTSKLLGFARGGQYEVLPTDLNELISKTVNIFGRTKKEIMIHQKYAKNLWTIEVDRNQIEQVLISIYVNAWQAMTSDGGDIYVETDNAVISENDAHLLNIKAGDYSRITITDTGSGMDEGTCRRVFEPFFTTKDRSRGAGLSLASAYGIIKEHGGTIEVESELGQGTIFSMYFPASVKEIFKETAGPKEIVKGVETILLVDDEESVLDVCKELLISMGYNVLSAGNGKEALSIYEMNKNGIDLVMLDMIMPGLSGGDTYDALKLINPQVKVMLSTGYSISEQAKKIMEKGCQALIQKPFRLEELSQKVREVLKKK